MVAVVGQCRRGYSILPSLYATHRPQLVRLDQAAVIVRPISRNVTVVEVGDFTYVAIVIANDHSSARILRAVALSSTI